jgi:MscS family membrane protein
MNKIFQEFYDLNVPNYTLWYVLGTIAGVLLIRKFISKYIVTLIYNLLKKAGKKLNKNAYYNLLVSPLQHFLVVIIIILALEKLTLPLAVKNYSLYGNFTIGNLLNVISVSILIISIIRLLIRIIDYIAIILEEKANLTTTQGDNQLIVFFKDFFKVILVIIGFLLLLKFAFGQHIGNLLTGLSIVGAAIALATKESLENLIASFIIFFDKPFITGDHLKVQNVIGEVEKIGLRSTRIRTDEKTYVTVPNKQMVDSIVDNHSLRTKRKVNFKLELDKSTSIEKIKQYSVALLELLKKKEELDNVRVYFIEINKQSNVLEVEYFTEPVTDDVFNQTKQMVNFETLQLLMTHQVHLAGVTTT